MLSGRGGFESPRALDGVDGEPGESFVNASSLCADDCGVAVSISGGLRFSPDGDGVGLVGEGGASVVGDRGAPPHCDINERTRKMCQSGLCLKARTRQARDCRFRPTAAGAGASPLSRFRTYRENEA